MSPSFREMYTLTTRICSNSRCQSRSLVKQALQSFVSLVLFELFRYGRIHYFERDRLYRACSPSGDCRMGEIANATQVEFSCMDAQRVQMLHGSGCRLARWSGAVAASRRLVRGSDIT